ncbi:MAG: biotin/lipoyl-containing protein, partial [Candidatus Dormibacteria bacterium]
MAYQVTMPQMGYDMTEGSINNWVVKEGDRVERGDVIASIATEKADIDIEAYASGVLRKILVQPGAKVPVGMAIAVIGDPDEQLPAAEATEPPKGEGADAPAPVEAAAAPAASPAAAGP